MIMEDRVEELIRDTLTLEFDLPLRRRIVPEARCETCGVENELNLDIYGNPNGYKSHQVGTCIQHLRERLDRLEAESKASA